MFGGIREGIVHGLITAVPEPGCHGPLVCRRSGEPIWPSTNLQPDVNLPNLLNKENRKVRPAPAQAARTQCVSRHAWPVHANQKNRRYSGRPAQAEYTETVPEVFRWPSSQAPS
jgi:hypothetical protein